MRRASFDHDPKTIATIEKPAATGVSERKIADQLDVSRSAATMITRVWRERSGYARWLELTAAQIQAVQDLALSGLTDRQIAGRLYLLSTGAGC